MANFDIQLQAQIAQVLSAFPMISERATLEEAANHGPGVQAYFANRLAAIQGGYGQLLQGTRDYLGGLVQARLAVANNLQPVAYDFALPDVVQNAQVNLNPFDQSESINFPQVTSGNWSLLPITLVDFSLPNLNQSILDELEIEPNNRENIKAIVLSRQTGAELLPQQCEKLIATNIKLLREISMVFFDGLHQRGRTFSDKIPVSLRNEISKNTYEYLEIPDLKRPWTTYATLYHEYIPIFVRDYKFFSTCKITCLNSAAECFNSYIFFLARRLQGGCLKRDSNFMINCNSPALPVVTSCMDRLVKWKAPFYVAPREIVVQQPMGGGGQPQPQQPTTNTNGFIAAWDPAKIKVRENNLLTLLAHSRYQTNIGTANAPINITTGKWLSTKREGSLRGQTNPLFNSAMFRECLQNQHQSIQSDVIYTVGPVLLSDQLFSFDSLWTILDNNPYIYTSNKFLDWVQLTNDELKQLCRASVMMQFADSATIHTVSGSHIVKGAPQLDPLEIVEQNNRQQDICSDLAVSQINMVFDPADQKSIYDDEKKWQMLLSDSKSLAARVVNVAEQNQRFYVNYLKLLLLTTKFDQKVYLENYFKDRYLPNDLQMLAFYKVFHNHNYGELSTHIEKCKEWANGLLKFTRAKLVLEESKEPIIKVLTKQQQTAKDISQRKAFAEYQNPTSTDESRADRGRGGKVRGSDRGGYTQGHANERGIGSERGNGKSGNGNRTNSSKRDRSGSKSKNNDKLLKKLLDQAKQEFFHGPQSSALQKKHKKFYKFFNQKHGQSGSRSASPKK